MKIIEKIKSFRVTKQNFSIIGAVLMLTLLFVLVTIVEGVLYAILLTTSLIIAIIILAKLVPWIESKLPDEKDKKDGYKKISFDTKNS